MNTTDSTIHYTAPYSQQSGICIYIYFYVLQLHCIELPKAYFAKLQEFAFTTCFFRASLEAPEDPNPYTFDNDLNLDFAVCLETFPTPKWRIFNHSANLSVTSCWWRDLSLVMNKSINAFAGTTL